MKMKKKLLIVFAVVLIAGMGLAACGPKATSAPATAAPATAAPATAAPATAAPATVAPAGKPIIAVCLPALDNPLMLAIQDTFVNGFGKDYDVQVVSADGNANNQAAQVQNFTAMKVKLLTVMAVEASSLVPNLIAARQQGILVLVIGGDPGNPDSYDSVMNMNQYLSGWFEAYMAKQWVDQTYPDAADETIPTAMLTSSLNPEAIARSNGMKMIAEPFMKDVNGKYIDQAGKVVDEANKVANPAYSSKVKVVTTVDAEMFQAGQTAMQNILTTNPDVLLVLAYAGDGGMGASQAILDEYAKGSLSVIKDLNKVAIFGVGMIGAEGPAVLDSATNKTVFRGTIRFGGDLVARTNEVVSKMLSGNVTKVIYDPLDIVTIVNGKLMSTAIESSEYFTVPTAQPAEVKLGPPPGG
jgi:ABC-type sugar transport system substrate-binding protein